MKIKSYDTSEDRTVAQTKAIRLKKEGCEITRIGIINDPTLPFNENNVKTIAFGYNKSSVPGIKKPELKRASEVNESDFEFIYWNI